MNRVALVIVFLFSSMLTAVAQADTLTLFDAVKLGMENNFSIRIARNDSIIAHNNNSLGNAGFLPIISVSAGSNNSINNVNYKYSDGSSYSNSTYPSYGLNAGLQLEWILFDGFAMFANRQRYSTLEEISSLQFQITVEDVVASIILNYYSIAIENNLLENYREALMLSRDRMRIAREKAAIGTSFQIAVMQAEVDYRADSSQMLQQVNKIQNLKINLNKLIGREPNINFNVNNETPEVATFELGPILNGLSSNNKEMQMMKLNLRLKDISLRQAKAAQYPSVKFTSAYNLARTSTPESLSMEVNRTLGPQFGVTAGIPIFNGFNIRRSIANALIERENQELSNQKQEQNLRGEAIQYYNNLVLAKNLVELEQHSSDLAKTNSDVAIEKYRIGVISDIELRDAQIKYLNAEYRYLEALMQAKTAEVALQVLMGNVKI